MKAVVLGSAAGGGFPQWNCRCANCELAWQRDARAQWRTQSSLAINAGEAVVMVNASPDIGQQLRAHAMLQPRASRESPIGTVVLTSAEIDHVAGLTTLRERHAFDLVALAPVHAAIAGNPLFEPLQARRITAEADQDFAGPDSGNSGLSLSLFPVPGKVPLYLETEGGFESSDGEVAGLAAGHGGASLLYVPGCAAISESLSEKARQADIILFDGTLFDDEEMIRAGLGPKTGRSMGHLPMTGPGGSLDWLAALPARRKIYVHINNSNPVLIEGSRERRIVESAGVEIAHDGLEIAL